MRCPLVLRFPGDAFDEFDDIAVPWPSDFPPQTEA